MIIECASCKKQYKIADDKLPDGKQVVFTCKNCGAKTRLDFRNESLNAGNSTGSQPDNEKLSLTAQSEDNPAEKTLQETILEGVKELPPMPEVVFKIQRLISTSDSDAKKIAGVIETDQALATKVLKVANSAYYGMSGKISSIQHASVLLGYEALGEIVTAAGAESILNGKLPGYGYESKDLWMHSLAVAFGSKIIANIKNPALAGEAHTAGLIHDVGKIILDGYILNKKEEIESFLEKEEKTFFDAEVQFFGFDHARIASEVCRKWKFPEGINSAIKYHHQPSAANESELAYILHMADYIATLSGVGYDSDDYLYELEPGTMDHLGLTQEAVSDIVLQVTEAVNKLAV
jgi:putative nucleotidyltransferase with HDIG domain